MWSRLCEWLRLFLFKWCGPVYRMDGLPCTSTRNGRRFHKKLRKKRE